MLRWTFCNRNSHPFFGLFTSNHQGATLFVHPAFVSSANKNRHQNLERMQIGHVRFHSWVVLAAAMSTITFPLWHMNHITCTTLNGSSLLHSTKLTYCIPPWDIIVFTREYIKNWWKSDPCRWTGVHLQFGQKEEANLKLPFFLQDSHCGFQVWTKFTVILWYLRGGMFFFEKCDGPCTRCVPPVQIRGPQI